MQCVAMETSMPKILYQQLSGTDINKIKAMAKSHTYHVFSFEDTPPHPPLLSG